MKPLTSKPSRMIWDSTGSGWWVAPGEAPVPPPIRPYFPASGAVASALSIAPCLPEGPDWVGGQAKENLDEFSAALNGKAEREPYLEAKLLHPWIPVCREWQRIGRRPYPTVFSSCCSASSKSDGRERLTK